LIGSRKQREIRLDRPAQIYIINYEGARIITENLLHRDFDLLVCDESHALKEPTSLRSKACYRLSQNIKHKIIMTGTPILNSPLDVFAQYRVLSPTVYGLSWYRFRARYAIMGGYMNKMVIKYVNMKDFKARLFVCSTIKTKEECLDLPDKLYETIRLDLPQDQRSMYKDLKDAFIAEFQDKIVSAPVMLTRLMRFSQITAGFYKTIQGEEHAFKTNPKTDWLIEWVKDNQKKIVVFCRFHKEIDMLKAALAEVGIGSVCVDGRNTDRMDSIHRFDNDPECKVFIGQIQVAGQGINLQSASYCTFLSNSYSYGERRQAEDRIHRIGQKSNCTYFDIVYRDTIDEKLLKVLAKKEELAKYCTKDIVQLV
jgi:SNF2 family DNA or RNA helicase